LASPIPYDVIVRRARASRAATLAELLLDQRVACGLGNVYKSELLFLHRCAPRSGVADAPDDLVEALFRRGAALLAANLGPGRRRTRGLASADPREPRFWVYDRGGRPCLRCATPVRVDRVGAQARVTYWCPQCQSVPQRLPSSTMDGGASDGREAPQAPRFR
jgi:endonuclease-8